MIFPLFFKWFCRILGPPYCGFGATIRISQEMLCLPYAGFFTKCVELVGGGLQAQTLPDEAPPVGKIYPFSKIAVTFEPI